MRAGLLARVHESKCVIARLATLLALCESCRPNSRMCVVARLILHLVLRIHVGALLHERLRNLHAAQIRGVREPRPSPLHRRKRGEVERRLSVLHRQAAVIAGPGPTLPAIALSLALQNASPSLYLSIYLSIYLFIYLSFYLSFYLSISAERMTEFKSFSPFFFLSFFLSF